jgi:vancomycin resistance protein VanJ
LILVQVSKPLIAGASWSYAAAITGFFLLRGLMNPLPSSLALLSAFAPYLFIPLLLALPLALWARSRTAALPLASVILLFAMLYGPRFVPPSQPPACAASPELRVMTWNLGWDRAQGDPILAVIAETRPDILGVQEVTPATAAYLERELGTIYPYRAFRPGIETSGLLSRYPIVAQEWIEPSGGGRPTLHATVDSHGQAVHVFVLHPWAPRIKWAAGTFIPIGLDDSVPRRQITEVARVAASVQGPTVVLGDFNMTDGTRAYHQVAERFVDAFREAGWGFGFTFPEGVRVGGLPMPGPLIRLDYIFHSAYLCTVSARVGCEGGSDHCYVLASLARTNR